MPFRPYILAGVVDVTAEAVGLPSTFQNAIDAVAFGGRVALIGVSKKKLDFDFTQIQKKEIDIYGSRNAMKEDFEELYNFVDEMTSPCNLDDYGDFLCSPSMNIL